MKKNEKKMEESEEESEEESQKETNTDSQPKDANKIKKCRSSTNTILSRSNPMLKHVKKIV